jgi:nitroreductase
MQAVTKFHPYASMLNNAALAIAVCGDKNLDSNTGYLIENASAASQNILLAAHAMGLGAVWLGIYPREKRVEGLIKLLHLPEHILPVSLISIGIPAETKPQENRYDAGKVRWNKW